MKKPTVKRTTLSLSLSALAAMVSAQAVAQPQPADEAAEVRVDDPGGADVETAVVEPSAEATSRPPQPSSDGTDAEEVIDPQFPAARGAPPPVPPGAGLPVPAVRAARLPERSPNTLRRVSREELRAERLSIFININQSREMDDAYRLFGDSRNVGGGGLAIAYNVLQLASDLHLHATAEYAVESSDGAWLYGRTSLDSQFIAGGAIVRYGLTPHISPFVRLVGGGMRSQATMDLSNGSSLRDAQVSPFGSAGFGLSLRTWPRRLGDKKTQGFLALNVEGGFTAVAPMTFHMEANAVSPDEDAIAVSKTDIGTLARARPHLRVSFSAHF